MMTKLLEAIGQYSVQCSETKELAPPDYLLRAISEIESQLAERDGQIAMLRHELNYFCGRVDEGSIQSKKTYERFKLALSATQSSEQYLNEQKAKYLSVASRLAEEVNALRRGVGISYAVGSDPLLELERLKNEN